MIISQKKLGEILIAKGLITSKQLKIALDEQRKTKEFFGKILLKKNQFKERDLLKVLSEQFNIPHMSLRYKYIDWQLIRQFNSSLIMDYKCFPVTQDEWSPIPGCLGDKKSRRRSKGAEVKIGFSF